MNGDVIELLTRAADATEAVLSWLDEADRTRPSPCPEMDVGQVAAHLIGGIRGFANVAEGGSPGFDPEGEPEWDLGAERARAAFREAIDRFLSAFSRPGRIDASYDMPWGPTTGAQLVGFELIETVVHGWDVARGLGIDVVVDDDVVATTLGGARQWVDDSVRVPGMFGPEVPVGGASLLDQLVAFLGRDPAWTG